MRWNDQYKIKVDALDDQHQEWFEKVAEFKAAINQEHMIAKIAHTLKFVVDYSQKHFSDEEDYMREINFPHIDHQIELHKAFMQKIIGVLTDLKSGKKIIPSQLHDFMADWIRQHILEHDMKIGEFLADQETDNPSDAHQPPKEQRDPLMSKLKELKTLLKSELITQEDHAEKTNDLLIQFASEPSAGHHLNVLDKFDRLTELQGQNLISEDGLEAVKELLSKDIDVNQVLNSYDSPKTKMHALNTLQKNSLITNDQFDKYKALVLSNI